MTSSIAFTPFHPFPLQKHTQ